MNEVSWTAVVLAGLTMVGTVVKEVVAYFGIRDKIKYDVRFAVLEREQEACKARDMRCAEEMAAAKSRIYQLERVAHVQGAPPGMTPIVPQPPTEEHTPLSG